MLPSAWPGFTARRLFRGVVYDIEVERGAEPVLVVDGVPIDGDVVPLPEPGRERVDVRVTIAQLEQANPRAGTIISQSTACRNLRPERRKRKDEPTFSISRSPKRCLKNRTSMPTTTTTRAST